VNAFLSKRLVFWPLLAFFYIAAWLMQTHLLLKGDIAWQMQMARSVLAGGNYIKDFFEINPPLSIYLYIPAVILQKLAGWSAIIALRIYIFAVASLTLFLCSQLLDKIFRQQDSLLKNILFFALVYVFLILPLSEFGQRECLLMYFTMPYFLLVAIRLEHKTVVPWQALGIGFLAGIGLALKPFFLSAMCLVELYYMFRQPRQKQAFFSWARPEVFAIFGFLILYVSLVWFAYPDYFKIVVPIAAQFYYQSFGEPWKIVLLNPIIFYIALVPLLFFLVSQNNPYKDLAAVLMTALGGFMLVYIMQQLSWYYHLLPAFGLTLILCILSFGQILSRLHTSRGDFFFAWILAVTVFAYPAYFVFETYNAGVNQKLSLQPMISEIHTRDFGKPVYFFSSKAAYMVSVLEHAGAVHASRLQFLAWMNGYYRLSSAKLLTQAQETSEKVFVRILADDLNHYKPARIYVDESVYDTILDDKKIQLNFIKILSRYSEFETAWRPYHYVKTEELTGNYKFAVYER
jgi:hypothetical protein